MKTKRCILIIDDKPQGAVAKGISSKLSNEFDIDFICIRTSAAELKKDDSEDVDSDKLMAEIESKISGKSIYLALTDFDLECDYLNGFDVIRMVHEIREKINFFIYSGNWEKVIKFVIGQDYKQASIEKLVDGINTLIHNKIIDCIDRSDYQELLIKYLRKNKGDSIEYRLSALLRANGEIKFESCFPEFKGKTFNEIADLIEGQSDARTEEWIEAVLTQTISYLVNVNQ